MDPENTVILEEKCPKCLKPISHYNYLEVEGVCTSCMIESIESNQTKKIAEEINLPAKYMIMTFDNFRINTLNRDAFNGTQKFLETKNKKGIYIYGVIGIGKTHLATATFKALYSASKKAEFVCFPDLLMEIRNTYSEGVNLNELDIINKYADIEYLFIDDLGVERISDFSIETLFLIINKRYANAKNKVFITSNYSLNDLATRTRESNQHQRITDDAIASRLSEMCDIYEIRDFKDNRVPE